MMFEIPEDEFAAIEGEITNPDSPVGIDAKKTHVIILHKLTQIEKRLAALEADKTRDP